MISVLICSVSPGLLKKVTENIKETIGVPFEVLFADNRMAKKGICEVYNELARKSQFDLLCFLHEDVELKTENWGGKLIEIFSNDKSIGLVGIAGSKYKSGYFSGWYTGAKELDCANYYHKYPSGSEHVFLSPTDRIMLQEVVCIDGVMICSTRKAWQLTLFDEKLLKGFHFYDIDFSLRVSQNFKTVITYDIDLLHITKGGDYGNKWVETAIFYHTEKKHFLPFSKIEIDKKKMDKKVAITTMDHLKNYKISLRNKLKWILLQKLYLNPVFYYSIAKFLLYQPLGLKKIHSSFKK